jgi:hypothetical protein
MDLRLDALSDEQVLDELAGITGLGWTASVLGALGSLAGYGNSLFSTLAVGPLSLLSLGVACFLATLGLDRLRRAVGEAEEPDSPSG